ncbi:MAG: hypothetical protein QM734_05480 [Cyclobacteriaceae bacterium]
MKIFYVSILVIGLFSCTKKKENSAEGYPIKILKSEDKSKLLFELDSYLVDELMDTPKVQVINSDCAIFVYPTHDQVEEMKKAQGEDDFYVTADDSNFYQSQAIQILDSAGIKTFGAVKRYLKFKGSEKSWILDIRKKDLPAWNLILFQKNRVPQPTPTIDLTYESVKNYFE